jgi:hypothetical protein
MKTTAIVKELEEAARMLGVRVRREKGSFRGGYCVRDGEEILMLNRNHPPEVHLAILATALRELPVDSIYVRPAVRVALEETWLQRTEIELEPGDDD